MNQDDVTLFFMLFAAMSGLFVHFRNYGMATWSILNALMLMATRVAL